MANDIHYSCSKQQMLNEDRGSAHPTVLDEYLLRAIPVYLTGSLKAEKVALPVAL